MSGAVGAGVLTLVHQGAKELFSNAPRMDVLGRKVISKSLKSFGVTEKIPYAKLQRWSLAGDLIANSFYYSLIGVIGRKHPLVRGAALGAIAGVGAITLPQQMNLPSGPAAKTPERAMMTFAWYLLGGLAAGALYKTLNRR